MFSSVQKPRMLTPALAAAFLVSLSGATAQAGRAVETIAAAGVTVISTAHYQATLALTCTSGGVCTGNFPAMGVRRRLNLTRMSCYLRSSTYATYATGKIELEPSNVLVQHLAADHSTEWGHHTINNAIDVQINARQYVSVALSLASGGQAFEATCTAHGTIEVLQ